MHRSEPSGDPSDQRDDLSSQGSGMASTPVQRGYLTPFPPPRPTSPVYRPEASTAPTPPAVPRVPSLPSMRPTQLASRHVPAAQYARGYPQYAMTPGFSSVFSTATSNPYQQPAPRVVPMMASAMPQASGHPVSAFAHPLEQTAAFAAQHAQQMPMFPFGSVPQIAQQLAPDVYALSSGSESSSHVTSALPSASSMLSGLEVSIPPVGDFAVDTALLTGGQQRSASMPSLRAHQDFAMSQVAAPQQSQYPVSPTGSDIRRVSNSLRPSGAPVFKPYYPSSPPPARSAGYATFPGATPSGSAGVSPIAISGPKHISQGVETWSTSSVDSPPSAHMSTKRIRFGGQRDLEARTVSSKISRDFEYDYTPTPTPPMPSPPDARDPYVVIESDEDRPITDDGRDSDFVPPSNLSPRKRAPPRSLQPPPKRMCADNALVALFEKYPSLPNRFPLFCFALEHNLSFHEPSVPMIKSLSQALSPLQKCEELKKLWHKGRRILAQLDAFVARCERKVIRPGDEKLPELDYATRHAIRQVRRKIVERCENYKYTRRDTLNKHVGKNKWEPIETGMIEWFEGMANNDPANDLGSFRPPSPRNFAAGSSSHAHIAHSHAVAPNSPNGQGEASRKAYEPPQAFTAQAPQFPRQPSGSDTSYAASEHGHLRPLVRNYSAHSAQSRSDVAPEAAPYGSASSGSGSRARALPQSGTSSISANVSPKTPQSPNAPGGPGGVDGNTVPISNSVVSGSLDEFPAAAAAGDVPSVFNAAAAAAGGFDSSYVDGSSFASQHPRALSTHDIYLGSESSNYSRPTSNHSQYRNEDGLQDLQDCGGSPGVPGTQLDNTVRVDGSAVVNPPPRSPLESEGTQEWPGMPVMPMSHEGSGSDTCAPTAYE